MKREIWLILFLLLAGFLLRAAISPLMDKGDTTIHFEWGKVLQEEGSKGIYFRQGWTYTFPTQPPLIMLLFKTSRWLYDIRWNLALWHNQIGLPPGFLITWFDRFGQSFLYRIWAILADMLIGLFIYSFIKENTTKQRLAIYGLVLYLFNPISIFISGVWGQNDLIAALFAVSCLYFFSKKSGLILSPLLLTIGLLIKPTLLIILPFYFFYVFTEFLNTQKNKRNDFILYFLLGLTFSMILSVITFWPFYDGSKSFLNYSLDIIFNRIMPMAKGVTRASVSAFNLFSAVFTIDRTLGAQKIFFASLDQIGLLFLFVIYLFSFALSKKLVLAENKFVNLSFILYFIVEGAFLFNTGMAERYFLIALIPSVILFIYFEKLRLLIIGQNLLWFINLIYSFFRRDISFLADSFGAANYLLIRSLSLLNIVVFLIIVYKFLKDKKLWNYR